jgi:ABC-type amino acid transport substrate-binding protein
MTKILTYVFIAVLAINFVGCSSKKTEAITDVLDLKGKVIGMVSSSASNESIIDLLTKEISGAPKDVLFFNRGTDLITALKSGKIDASPLMKIGCDYFIQRNNDLKMLPQKEKGECSIIMAVRAEDQKLKDDLDNAITTLQENGTLKLLEDKWLTNLPVTNEPSNKEISKIEGAKTYYVGVTGDYVPLDYIAADGKPSGYNVALLTEIGKLLNVNFEFVSLEAQAKFYALSSKKIDIIFSQFYSNQIASLFANIKGRYILTKPYYISDGLHFMVKK